MYQVNVRVGECPYTGGFESTINGVKKPFQETLNLASEMLEKGEGSPITIDGKELRVEKALYVGNRIVAEAHGE